MSNYSDYEMIEQKLRDGMYAGNMHACLRDVGSIAGGCLATGRISQEECDGLCRLAVALSQNKAQGERKWREAVEYGKKKPLNRSEITYASPRDGGHAIDWDEKINPDEYKIVDENWIESADISIPKNDWNPCAQLREYLTLLFEPDEHVAYCTDPFERDGKFIPTQGTYHKTVKEILSSLKKNTKSGFEEAVGTPNEKCGAWIVINPVDGKGRKDENVTDFRYALIESDNKPIEEQVAIYRKLELPCACIVHSGGKSAHAIVKVMANSIDEYRKRVDFLYEVCNNNHLPVDKQNRNPSRYSRMPGVMRGENKQFIIDRNCGKASWDEWEGWIKDLNDDLPDFETLTDEMLKSPPPKAPELIANILRVNHKMCIVGPSKAGKSFLLIELAIAVAEGIPWLGHACMQGRVLYINLELDKNSCYHRFHDVYSALEIKAAHNDFIDIWNMRGRTMPLDKLTPKLIRRAQKRGYCMIIVDPIYKVLTGDENSASEMASFCNLFDRIARDCGSAIVYCHHHSKGSQGDKRSMDRASGSGVFARDPDAMIDLLPLDTVAAKPVLQNKMELDAMLKTAAELAYDDNWDRDIPIDDKIGSANKLMGDLQQIFDEQTQDAIRKSRQDAVLKCDATTGWRASFTLREFASPKPQNMWFSYPRHLTDDGNYLDDANPEGEEVPKWKKNKKKEPTPKIDKVTALKNLLTFPSSEIWTVTKVCEQLNCSASLVNQNLKKLGYRQRKGIIELDPDSPLNKLVQQEFDDDNETPPF